MNRNGKINKIIFLILVFLIQLLIFQNKLAFGLDLNGSKLSPDNPPKLEWDYNHVWSQTFYKYDLFQPEKGDFPHSERVFKNTGGSGNVTFMAGMQVPLEDSMWTISKNVYIESNQSYVMDLFAYYSCTPFDDSIINPTIPIGIGIYSENFINNEIGPIISIRIGENMEYFAPYIGMVISKVPTVSNIVPLGGPESGGTMVTISGTGFIEATDVKFGDLSGTDLMINSDTSLTVTSPAGTGTGTGTGTVDVTVATSDETSVINANNQFTYYPIPVVGSIIPKSGPEHGGTSITINGTGFTGATAVKFGTTEAKNYTVNNDTSITAFSPAGTGTVDVTVTTPGGNSAANVDDQFTYYPAPIVTNILPNSGLDYGGTSVTINGTGFTGATAVKFGTTEAKNYTVNSDTWITAFSPAGTGKVDVTVTTPNGGNSVINANDQFTYYPVPVLSSIVPNSGPEHGGTLITINGTGFTGATAVKFGTTESIDYTVNNDTSITAFSPAGTGKEDVTITTSNGGTSAINTNDQFTYYPVPVVSKISPDNGYEAGGTEVTITGTGFSGATAVKFGTKVAKSYKVNSDLSITAFSPAGTGLVDVTVTTPGGYCAINANNRFTYYPVPVVSRISPNTGDEAGGTKVTITGIGFMGATAVKFGTTVAKNYTVNNDTSITAFSPAGTGPVDVTVTTLGGTSTTSYDDLFTYFTVWYNTISIDCSGKNLIHPVVVPLPPGSYNGVSIHFQASVSLYLPAGINMPETITVKMYVLTNNIWVYQFMANGASYQFNKPINITLPALGISQPALYYRDSYGIMELMSIQADNRTGSVTFTTDHFGEYVVAEPSTASKPDATPAGGNYPNPKTVTLTSTVAVKILYYVTATIPNHFDYSQNYQTVDGNSGSLTIDASKYLVAIGVDTNGLTSAPLIAKYNIINLNPKPFVPSRVQFEQADFTVNENDGMATITVNRIGGERSETVHYTTMDGTAIAGEDYTTTDGVLRFDEGETSKNFTIPIIQDRVLEDNETVNLTLSNPQGGALLGNPSAAILTIRDELLMDQKKYYLTYDGNGNTGGTVPTVPTEVTGYVYGQNVTVMGNTGNIVRSGYTFNGWNTTADGSGTSYTAGNAFNIGLVDMTLYAQWTVKANHGGGGGSNTSSPTSTIVTGRVKVGTTGTDVSNITATITTGSSGNVTVLMNAAQLALLMQPDGTTSPLSDLSQVVITSATGTPVPTSADGTVQMSSLAKGSDENFNVTYDLGNGQRIIIGTLEINIDSKGNATITEKLIDPYGIITDSVTGKALLGVNVTLYNANTERNKAAGKTPDTMVDLPDIPGRKPNNNQVPQTSDSSGVYGFMVFPDTDYYIVAIKDGYTPYTSSVISVGQEIIYWDFKMYPIISGVTRLAGESQVDTALAIAKAEYSGKVTNVILTTADNYPDALSGSVLAYKLNAPILIVSVTEGDQTKVLDYMKTNMDSAGTVYILGGTAAVSSAMENKVTASGFAKVTRLGGTDRYETSVKIADQLKVKTGTPIVLAYGDNYPDALSISSIAAQMQYPILLVQKDALSDAVKNEIAAIRPNKVYIIGGTSVISSTLESQVSQITSLDNTNIVRIAGTDRYETSLAVAQYFNLTGQNVCITTGNNFPDALAGSVYAANQNASIILADGRLSDQVVNYLESKKLTGATLFGGEAVVSHEIELQVGQLIGSKE